MSYTPTTVVKGLSLMYLRTSSTGLRFSPSPAILYFSKSMRRIVTQVSARTVYAFSRFSRLLMSRLQKIHTSFNVVSAALGVETSVYC